jgi:DNA-binding response OmpR family regulator
MGIENVLVVEDNEIARKLLTRRLDISGYHVETVENYEDALAALQGENLHLGIPKYHMLVLDVNLGTEKGGIDLARYAIGHGYTGKIIFMTEGKADETMLQKGNMQQYPYIRKPFDITDLIAKF